jgi:hypothetical protein
MEDMQNLKTNKFVHSAKQTISRIDSKMCLVTQNIDDIFLKIQDFTILEQNFADTERYVGHILPMKIQ